MCFSLSDPLFLCVPCSSLPIIFSIPQWQMMHAFPFGVKTSCFVGTHSNKQEYSAVCVLHHIRHHPPNTTQIHFSPSRPPSLSHTRRARLLVQEDVCSAHFNMNIIILYLAANRFSCHKPTQASSFYSWTLWDKNHIHFLTTTQMSLCKKKKKKRLSWVATSIFDGREKRYAGRVDIWPLPRCINGGQIGGQTSIFHPHFALGFHTYLNISPNADSDIETLNYHRSVTDKRRRSSLAPLRQHGDSKTPWSGKGISCHSMCPLMWY